MKSPFTLSLPVVCLAAVLTFGACANSHQAAANQHRPNVASSSPSGVIPSRDGRDAKYVAGNEAGGGNGDEYSVPTGSHIPRHTTREGYTTDAADPTFVYDQNDIRFRSTDNVSDQLRTIPGVSVRGGY